MPSRAFAVVAPSRRATWQQARTPALRFLSRHRRTLVAGLLALAVVDVASALRPGAGATAVAVVARHDLVVGHVVTPSDVETRSQPVDTVPEGALASVGEAVGATLTSDVRHGEVLTDARVSSGFAGALAPGEVAAPIRLADGGVAAVLAVGQVVDLIASSANGSSRTVATDARVIAVPGGDPADPLAGVLVVLAVPSSVAADVVAAGHDAALSVVLH